MAYGLRIINDDSELLIDSEYFNPTFVQKIEFNTTATLTEAATGYIHPGYIKREYTSSTAVPFIGVGSTYIVMWTLPDNGASDIYYNFETSIAYSLSNLICYVYANSTGSALTYTLPTAYIFAIDALGLENIASTGPALRMYNSANPQRKTFDSNLLQLVPYSITDTFAFSISGTNPNNYGTTPVSIALSVPTNPIFMLPDYHALRINKGPVNSIAHQEYLYQTAFKRIGTTLYTRLYVVDYYNEDYAWPLTQTTFTSGNNNQLSVIVADADFYQSVTAGGGGGGSNPTYTLSSNFSSRDEGTTVVVTLTTTLVADGSSFPYTVTGISAADLSAGAMTGSFIVYSNTATASFTFLSDVSTGEGAETFILSLDNLAPTVSVTVNDSSQAIPPSYSWSTPGNVNEGATGFTTFNASNANGKVVAFDIWSPSTGVSISGSSDGALLTSSWTISGNTATSINVQYSAVADQATEGPEAFRLRAVVDGAAYFSNDITVNDTSKTIGYSIAAADNWNESNTYVVTVSASNVNGTTLYLTTDNSLVVPSSSSVVVNSDTFSTNVNYSGGMVTANTTVRLHLRTGSAAGTIQAFKDIVLTNVTPSYSFGAVSAMDEGTSSSVQFNFSYAANAAVTFSVIAPSTGTSGVSDVTLNTTSHTVGNTNSSGNVSVTYSVGNDLSTSEGEEKFRIRASIGASVLAESSDITINDSSRAAGYSFGTIPTSIDEGSSGTFNFTTSNVVNGTTLYWNVTNSGDFSTSSGSFTITTNAGSFSVSPASDVSTNEGAETFQARVYTDSGRTNLVATSASVTINDTSRAAIPTYTLTRNVASVIEGGSFTITFATNQAGLFAYTITGVSSADISSASLTGTVGNGSVLTYTASNDLSTDEGTETFSITLDNGLSNTATVTISDTSRAAASYSILSAPTSIANGSSATFTHRSSNASGVTVTVSDNSTRASVSPTSFTIGSNQQTDTSITITTTSPTSSVAAETVTVTCSPGGSFTFTIPAETITAPIWYAYDQATPLSWTVPAGRTSIRVALCGGGAGGGGGSAGTTPAKGGGGGGSVRDFTYAVSPGQNLTITVGAGGSGGFSPTAGGTSSISGGSGGTQSAAGGNPGSGFTGGASGTPFSGGSGNNGAGGGGGGSASTGFGGGGGEGGDGGFGTSITTNATYYVAGGGGGASRSAIPGAGDSGGGTGAASNNVTQATGGAATFYGSGGGGGVNGGGGGAGFRGIVMWLG